jgi:4-amino-4-deoxy-L-arabinose transferase-like glycosyltransferase
MQRKELGLLGLLLLVYLILGALFAVRTPAWQSPDEPAHYNYVRQLAEGNLPIIEPGDWDQTYLSEVVGAEFDPAYSVEGLTYEDWQPPLYYLLQVPVFRLSDGSLTAMRFLSVVLGAGVVVMAYVVGQAVFDGRAWQALAVAAFVAFLPQHLAMMGSVNNDSLAELIIAAVLVMLVLPWPDRPAVGRLLALGLLLGAGFMVKGTVYLLAPVVVALLLARYRPRSGVENYGWRPLRMSLVAVFVPALLIGGLLWTRNAVVYGQLDILARGAHDVVVVGQPRTAEWLAQYGLSDTISRFARTTFNSFWGQFGWMAAPLPGWMYALTALLTAVALIGLLLATVTSERQTPDGDILTRHSSLPTRHSLDVLVLGLTFLLTLALHIVYNLTFVQHQGRYLFPALIPVAAGFTAGLSFWFRPLLKRWSWAGYLLPLGLFTFLGGISLYALWRILPGLAPG